MSDDSILNTIKKLLGISEDCKDFDNDLIVHINSAFMVLSQLGIGPEHGFSIEDSSETWNDYISDEEANLEAIKTYIHLKVKVVFDPPLNSTVMEAHQNMIRELEWRLNINAERGGV